MAKAKKKSVYCEWEESGKLPQIINFIKESVRKSATQGEIADRLGITQETLCRMKTKHKDIRKAFFDSKLDLKSDLTSAILKRALGFEYYEEDQLIEDKGKGVEQKRKIHRVKKQVPPDLRSAIYLLTKNFGVEFSERYEEIKLVTETKAKDKEEWSNGDEEFDDNAKED